VVLDLEAELDQQLERTGQEKAKAAGRGVARSAPNRPKQPLVSRSGPTAKPAASAIGHPVRVRILEVVNEVDMSPSEFHRLGMVGFEDKPLNFFAPHFGVLEEAGLIVVVKKTPGRNNCIEKTYRGVARAIFTAEEWAELDKKTRFAISKAVSTGFMARVDGALLAQTIDSRLDRNLYWRGANVDEQGWDEVAGIIESACNQVAKVCDDAQARLEEVEENGIPLTVGLFSFESPVPDWEGHRPS
jgi:Helix-turn-helix domain